MTRSADVYANDLQAEMPHVRRYALSIAGSADRADDLTQTALEQALRNRGRIETGVHGEAGLRRWLFTVVRNAHLDDHRKTARRGAHVPLEDWFPEVHARAPQEAHVELGQVTRDLDRLRPEERDVLSLRVFGGLSHDEIAGRLGVAVGTVKSRLARARRHLSAVSERSLANRPGL